MGKLDAIGFGALNVDELFRVNSIAIAEEESFVTGFSKSCGGSAANTMIGLARLGCATGFIGKVARDPEGIMLLDEFRKSGVDTRGISVAKRGRSGKVMGFVDRKGARALYIDPGVNDEIVFNEIDGDYASNTTFLHLTSFVGEKSFQAQKRLLKTLPKEVKVSFDPGSLYAKLGLRKLQPIVDRTFVFLPNAGELALLTGKADYRTGAMVMLDKGVNILAVKLREKGCYVTNGKEDCLVPSFKVKVVDTTGAGDAFNAGFIYGLLSDMSLYEAGKAGNFVASRCIEVMGARAGLPPIKSLQMEMDCEIHH